MNVGFFSPEYPPHCFGTGYYSKNLVEAMADKGIRIELVSDITGKYAYRNVSVNNMNVFRSEYYPLKWLGYETSYNFFLAHLRRKGCIIHENGIFNPGVQPPDVMTIHNMMINLLHVKVETERKKWYSVFDKGGAIKMLSKIEMRMIRKVKSVIALTPKMAHDLVKIYKIPRERITTISGGIKIEEFSKQRKRKDFILFSGRFHWQKGLYHLLEAASLSKADGLKIVITGMDLTNPANLLQKEIAEYGLEDKVKVLGFVPRPKLIELMAEAKGLILPSTYESFGITALEAMASRTPLLISNGCGLSGFLENRKHAVIFDSGVEGIKSAIDEFWDDKALQARLSSQGYQKAREFQWNRIADKVIGVYEGVNRVAV